MPKSSFWPTIWATKTSIIIFKYFGTFSSEIDKNNLHLKKKKKHEKKLGIDQ